MTHFWQIVSLFLQPYLLISINLNMNISSGGHFKEHQEDPPGLFWKSCLVKIHDFLPSTRSSPPVTSSFYSNFILRLNFEKSDIFIFKPYFEFWRKPVVWKDSWKKWNIEKFQVEKINMELERMKFESVCSCSKEPCKIEKNPNEVVQRTLLILSKLN